MVAVLAAGFTDGGGVSKAASLLAEGRVAPFAGANNHIIISQNENKPTLVKDLRAVADGTGDSSSLGCCCWRCCCVVSIAGG